MRYRCLIFAFCEENSILFQRRKHKATQSATKVFCRNGFFVFMFSNDNHTKGWKFSNSSKASKWIPSVVKSADLIRNRISISYKDNIYLLYTTNSEQKHRSVQGFHVRKLVLKSELNIELLRSNILEEWMLRKWWHF